MIFLAENGLQSDILHEMVFNSPTIYITHTHKGFVCVMDYVRQNKILWARALKKTIERPCISFCLT